MKLVALVGAIAAASVARADISAIPVQGHSLSYLYHLGEIHQTSTSSDRVRLFAVPPDSNGPELTYVLEISSDWRPPKYGKGGLTRSWNIGELFSRVNNVSLSGETVTVEGSSYTESTRLCAFTFHFEDGLLAETLEDRGCEARAIQSFAGDDAPSVAQIMEAIRTHGADRTGTSLSDHYPAWASVIQGVWSGDPEYLTLAATLRSSLDRFEAMQLDNALFMALARNPVSALKLLADPRATDGFYVQTVCALDPSVNDSLTSTAWRALLEERIEVLSDLGDEQVDAVSRACRFNLERALNFLPE